MLSFSCVLRRTLALLLPMALGACSYSYTDEAGNRRVIGLVDMTIAPGKEGTAFAGTVVDVTTVGAAIAQNAQGFHLTLGYSRDTTAAIRDDALVIGNPLAARTLLSARPSPNEEGKAE